MYNRMALTLFFICLSLSGCSVTSIFNPNTDEWVTREIRAEDVLAQSAIAGLLYVDYSQTRRGLSRHPESRESGWGLPDRPSNHQLINTLALEWLFSAAVAAVLPQEPREWWQTGHIYIEAWTISDNKRNGWRIGR